MEKARNSESEIFTSLDSEDSLGQTPNWLIKWGVLTLFLILFIVLFLSSIIKYPEIIQSPIEITTVVPPVQLVSNANGRLQYLLTKDGELARTGDILAVIESACHYESVVRLKGDVIGFRALIEKQEYEKITFSNYGLLGDLQSGYNEFTKSVLGYQIFFKGNSYKNKIKNMRGKIAIVDKSQINLSRQEQLLNEDFQLTKTQYNRDSVLFKTGVLSSLSWETSNKAYIKDQYSLEILKSNILTLSGQKLQLIQDLQELEDEFTEQTIELEQNILTSINTLTSQILKWENEYLIKSPCVGKVVLNNFWTAFQNVKLGDNILIVVPQNSDSLIGRIRLQVLNSGKVKVGQKINIKLDAYSYIEYGMLNGIVSRISSIPENSYYTVEASLPGKLQTTYDKQITYQEKLIGKAEIITDDISLLERFLFRFIAVFKK